MSGSFAHPPIGFGPGSQPPQDEEGLHYLAMPSGVATYAPHVPDIEDPGAVAPALAFLGRLHAALAGWKPGDTVILQLDGLDDENRAVVHDALGEGEVSVLAGQGTSRIAVQESVFAGVWSLRAQHRQGAAQHNEYIEIAAFPHAVLARAFPARAAPDMRHLAKTIPGVVNAPAILTELLDRSAAWQPGAAPHVVNLTLLPHTEEDLDLIATVLGQGQVTILSRGYGNCRIESTATPHVWRVRYFNSMDTLILDTIEVSRIPEVACAAREDIADSAQRVAEIRAAIQGEVA